MENLKLYMLLLGCKPPGRHTEQHDIFFGIAGSLKELIPDIIAYWPGAGTIHVDAWRAVTHVSGYDVTIRQKDFSPLTEPRLFFLNLGGYKPGEFEEFHYKMLVPAESSSEAIKIAKASTFFQQMNFKGAESHIDDKYGLDVDDIYDIADILPETFKKQYEILLTPNTGIAEADEMHLGYFPMRRLAEE